MTARTEELVHPKQEPTFLPLTVGVARSAATEQADLDRKSVV